MEFQTGPDQRVLALLDPGPGAAPGGLSPEHGVHDGGEVESTEPRATETTRSPGTVAAERVAALIVDGPFVGIAEHLVGLAEFLEPLGGVLALGHVRMHLHGLAAGGLLDLLRRGILVDPEDFVVVLAQCSAFREDTAHVSRHGAYGCDGGGIVHAGGTDHPE